ncbi:hypothetical protein ACTXT7_003869 [Hymenolepis weldensis]
MKLHPPAGGAGRRLMLMIKFRWVITKISFSVRNLNFQAENGSTEDLSRHMGPPSGIEISRLQRPSAIIILEVTLTAPEDVENYSKWIQRSNV